MSVAVPNLKLLEVLSRWLVLQIKELTLVKKIAENWQIFDEDEPLVCTLKEQYPILTQLDFRSILMSIIRSKT
jgi:hypothetical protein